MKFSVDRIENGFAVCEKADMSIINIPLSSLPKGTKEGSVLEECEDGEFALLEEEEAERRKRISKLQNKLFS